MYPEYENINSFLSEAEKLLNTSMHMEDIFNSIMRRNERNIAAEFYNDKNKLKHYKYAKVRSNAYGVASVLAKTLCQKEKNRPVVLKLANSPRWGEIFWAILMSGYKPLLIDSKTSKDGTQNLINQSHAIAIVSDDMFSYENILKIPTKDLYDPSNHSYSFSPSWENEIIFCSSGTTGDVKLMVFNGENICHQICCSLDMAKETKDIMYPKKYGKIKILAMIPFHHIFGFVAVYMWYSFYGKTIVYPSSNSSSDIQSLCLKAHVTHVYSVPLFWDALAQQIQRKFALLPSDKQVMLDKMIGYNTGKISKEEAGQAASKIAKDKVQNMLLGNDVRYCISGGGFLSQDTLTIINGVGYNLYNGYGMTEIGVTSVELSPDISERLKGRIGKPLHGVNYKLASIKSDGIGELLIKSPTSHIREIIGGEEKATTFDEDGYLKTGDLASSDADGRYQIRGRIKDVIINADGENIFPDELEIFFNNLPHVKHVCVVGISIKNSQDQKVTLVLEVDNQITEEEIKTLHQTIDDIKLPHGIRMNGIYLAKKQLPLANNMKVKRFLVKKDIEGKSKDYISIDHKSEQKTFTDLSEKEVAEILIPMREMFSKILILPSFKIDDDAHWINDLGGDSMSYVELIKEIQEKFQITFPEEVLGHLTCINDFVAEVARLRKNTKK